jgi:hypothetical protein
MRIPVTDAFDESTPLQSLEVELTPRQIEWLEQQANERGLSVDHMLRALITKQIRGATAETSPSAHSGDGAPPASSEDSSGKREETAPPDAEEGPTSIVESLRSASERLQDLTDEDETGAAPDLADTLDRLKARRDGSDARATDENNDAVVVDDSGPSMFDLVEE